MKIVQVDKLPKQKKFRTVSMYHSLKNFFDEFMAMNIKFARIDIAPKEYASPRSAYESLHKVARQSELPIVVKIVNKELYLIRTDLD